MRVHQLPSDPVELLVALGADWKSHNLQAREASLRALQAGQDTLILRGTPLGGRAETWSGDTSWLHLFLGAVRPDHVETPRPVPLLDGQSWGEFEGVGYELLSFVPGEVVAWDRSVPMEAVGALLADYHQASERVDVPQRPTCFPVVALSGLFAATDSDSRSESRGEASRFLDQLDEDLERINHRGLQQLVIHGDFTNHNVIMRDGVPTGCIDFALAYHESFLADIGFALWRSARPHQDSPSLDPQFVARFSAGYHTVRPLPATAPEAIPTYIRARGIQMFVKSVLRGQPARISPEVHWLADNVKQLSDAIDQALNQIS